MDYFESLQPGKRENAFFVEHAFTDREKIGVQSPKNEKFYVYYWDPEKNQRVSVLVDAREVAV